MKLLKTSILVLIILTSFNAEAKRIKIKESRGGQNGYRYVTETHNWFGYNHVLDCYEPGYAACGWYAPPTIGGYGTDEIMRFVRTEIANGNNSGATLFNNAVRVTWTYDDENGLEVVMDDDI